MSKQDDEKHCSQMVDVAEQIKLAMELRGVANNTELCAMTGIARATLCSVLQGTRMSLRQLVKIAEALDCEVEVTLKTRPKQRRDYAIEWEGAA